MKFRYIYTKIAAVFLGLVTIPNNFLLAQEPDSVNTIATSHLTIHAVKKQTATTIAIQYGNQQQILIDFYSDRIFRFFDDGKGGSFKNPIANPPADILVSTARRNVSNLNCTYTQKQSIIETSAIKVAFDNATLQFKIWDKKTGALVLSSTAPLKIAQKSVTISLQDPIHTYYYGGGVQNGRFSHKGKVIAIENQNSWTSGGVASPAPFFWSTAGYGILWHTFQKGKYDFDSQSTQQITLSHQTDYLDVFFMIDAQPKSLLADYFQLTGKPALLPKFGFYEGHLNAYNRDFWKKDSAGILFEDGNHYKESQKEDGGIKESLNGEKENYQFSARAVIDRYRKNDLPLGWILPNDGYGAGYGQTSTLDSNIANLKSFGEYARADGVQIGLWTQSDLHPKAGVSALLQRDIIKEVKDAGVRVLKTDVAWVGDGYSFGLNGVADVAHIMPKYGNDARPFIISLDGWAGTQRYAGIWTGDQTGGDWEYIRFHIPTYIGAGLSGIPNITSDMDGIFGGEKPIINARDFEWKAFTPMQLNMDGWGSNPKYPSALGEPTTSINRTYLKLKSQLLPYTYSIAHQSVDSLPMIRALFLSDSNAYTLGTATQYEYLYGPNFLIAPIYKNTASDKWGNDVRNNIYLPKGIWYDYFSGQKYEGGKVLNSFDAPLWKLPIFVKAGAIIPLVNANNNISEIDSTERIFEFYPTQNSSFSVYDDDGKTQAYQNGESSLTPVSVSRKEQYVDVFIGKTKGTFSGFTSQKSTLAKINVSAKPKNITISIGGHNMKLTVCQSLQAFVNSKEGYYFNAHPKLNRFSTLGSSIDTVDMNKNAQVWIKLPSTDITKNDMHIKLSGFVFDIKNPLLTHSEMLTSPTNVQVLDSNASAYSLRPSWSAVSNTDFYEMKFDGMLYSQIKDTSFLFEDLEPNLKYRFSVRAVNKKYKSPWVDFDASTKENPLEFAIPNILASASAESQPGDELSNLVDRDENSMWHTKWQSKAVPFDLILDLKSVNSLDKISYLPRMSGVNGMILHGNVFISKSRQNWDSVGTFNWPRTSATKDFQFSNHPQARYIKIKVDKAYGDFGSGREMYVFKVPKSESVLQGDINHDGKVDANDLTSYMNYTGLRKGDKDFEGYISNGDINENGWIDAYDISTVATQLDGGIQSKDSSVLTGELQFSFDRKTYLAGSEMKIIVSGVNLKNVNALSFELPYNPEFLSFQSIKPINMLQMENFTYDRLHSDGSKALYPTFVNIGDKTTISGNKELFEIIMKVKKDTSSSQMHISHSVVVDAQLNELSY